MLDLYLIGVMTVFFLVLSELPMYGRIGLDGILLSLLGGVLWPLILLIAIYEKLKG